MAILLVDIARSLVRIASRIEVIMRSDSTMLRANSARLAAALSIYCTPGAGVRRQMPVFSQPKALIELTAFGLSTIQGEAKLR